MNKKDADKKLRIVSKKALQEIFRNLEFTDDKAKKILLASYIDNLDILLLYAREHRISQLNYICSIKEVLLRDKNVRER